MMEYNICYSLDSKYAEQLSASICSVLNVLEDNEQVNFYILDGGLTKQDKIDIEKLKNIKDFSVSYINIKRKRFKIFKLPRKFTYIFPI